VIDILPDQKMIEGLGGNMRLGGKDIELKPGTLASELFGNVTRTRLRFRHRYEVDPKYIPTLEQHGLVFSGKHPTSRSCRYWNCRGTFTHISSAPRPTRS